jgi:hypothetical protein
VDRDRKRADEETKIEMKKVVEEVVFVVFTVWRM